MLNRSFEIGGNIVDVVEQTVFQGTIVVRNGRIAEIRRESVNSDRYILPGLVDAHIHIESSMLIPSEFARIAVTHGTVATVSDPHEIANVLGINGVRFMIENGRKVPFRFYFGAPSCVPATSFETSGAQLGVQEVSELLKMNEINYLSELMNYPGVLFDDPEVMGKINFAVSVGKPVDGHAPGLTGSDAEKYIKAGITTDHECTTIEEAKFKIGMGMKVLIREGSAAKDFNVLSPLIEQFPDDVMLCSDDKHPDDLIRGHVNLEVKRALGLGINPMKVFRSCTANPVKHYKLDTGLLQPGDSADFIMVDNLSDFNVLETYINGELCAANGRSTIPHVAEEPYNNFNINEITVQDILVTPGKGPMKVIHAIDGLLTTKTILAEPLIENGLVISDLNRDILKIVVVNRYKKSKPSVGFIHNFSLKRGAFASCVAHDSHNIVAIGVDDASIIGAINQIINHKGGISLVNDKISKVLPLPFAGIMSGDDGFGVGESYHEMDRLVKGMGTTLTGPFMTLSFMALLVIPELKISDLGLFDGTKFQFASLFDE